MPVTPTTDSGWATYLNGSRLFLPAATNACTNPKPIHTAAALPVGWSGLNLTNSTPTYSDGGVYNGITSKHIRVVGGVGCSAYVAMVFKLPVNGECTAGDVITVSAMLGEAAFAGCSMRLIVGFYKDDGTFISSSWGSAMSPGAGFARYSDSFTAPALATKYMAELMTYGDFHAGDSLEFSIAQVSCEKSSVLTPYFDGSTTEGGAGVCAWTGTANASTSTRAGSALVLPVASGWLNTAATIAARVVPLFPGTLTTGTYKVVTMRDAAGTGNTLGLDFTNTAWRAIATGTGSVVRGSAAQSFAIGTAHNLVMRTTQGAGTLDLNNDGTNAVQAAQTKTLNGGTALAIGNYVGDYQGCAHIGPVLISPSRKSDAWTTAIQANNGSAYGSIPTLWNTFMEAGDLLLPLSANGRGYVKGTDAMPSGAPWNFYAAGSN